MIALAITIHDIDVDHLVDQHRQRQHRFSAPHAAGRPPAAAPYSAAIADHKPISGIASGPRQGKLDAAQADRAGRADVARTVLGQQARAVDEGAARGAQILQAEPARRRSAAGHAAGRPTDRAPTSSVGCAAGAPVRTIGCGRAVDGERHAAAGRCRQLRPPVGQRRGERRQGGGLAQAPGGRTSRRRAMPRSRAGSSRGQRMKANTHSSTSGTIEPTPVSVSRIAPSPAQPGRPAFSTMRHAIQAASTAPTRAKALLEAEASPSGPRSRSPSLNASPASFAVRPVAEGQHRHDDERADHRHEMEQRQRAGEARPACRCARSE